MQCKYFQKYAQIKLSELAAAEKKYLTDLTKLHQKLTKCDEKIHRRTEELMKLSDQQPKLQQLIELKDSHKLQQQRKNSIQQEYTTIVKDNRKLLNEVDYQLALFRNIAPKKKVNFMESKLLAHFYDFVEHPQVHMDEIQQLEI